MTSTNSSLDRPATIIVIIIIIKIIIIIIIIIIISELQKIALLGTSRILRKTLFIK